jgi:hypothetical protein
MILPDSISRYDAEFVFVSSPAFGGGETNPNPQT